MLLYDQAHKMQFGLWPVDKSVCVMGTDDGLGARLCSSLKTCVPFEITNVSEFLYTGTDQENWDMAKDFPRLVPPFNRVWFEWKYPKKIVSNKHGVRNTDSPFSKMGAFVTFRKVDDTRFHVGITMVGLAANGMGVAILIPYRFALNAKTFELIPGFNTGESSKALQFIYLNAPKELSVEDTDSLIRAGNYSHCLSMPCLLAISLLNCRNVTTRLVKTPDALARSHRRKGHTPPTDYHVIEIQPMRQKIMRETGQTGYSRGAAAIIRGHFKNYQEGHGLFGKLHGMYWWDQRVTGQIGTGRYELSHAGGRLDREWVDR